MKKYLLAVVGAVSVSNCQTLAEYESWKYEPTIKAACYWTNLLGPNYGIPCAEVEEPTVVVTSVVWRFLGDGTLGFYAPGEGGVVYLSDKLPWQGTKKLYTLEAVRVHESVHYLLDKYTNRMIGRCESEEMARRVTAAWEGEAYDPEWEVRYNCGPNARWFGVTGIPR